MAQIFPFKPYRYSASAGDLRNLITQPYDKINPAMQAGYLAASPHNLVRVILGERFPSDTAEENVYTRSARFFEDWIRQGILEQDAAESFYAYFQEFALPDSGERLIRKGFIGLGPVEPYEKGIVYRHEQTLSGPKKDRRQVLDHTMAHFGQLFMLYPDPDQVVDALLDEAAHTAPLCRVVDEYDTVHILYRISDQEAIASIRHALADKKLLIADGHHRYETALAYRQDHPECPDASRVMMTFVNMHSPGLRILATHRVVSGLAAFDQTELLTRLQVNFLVTELSTVQQLKARFHELDPASVRIGLAFPDRVLLLERPRAAGELDVRVLHEELLEGALGISAEAVREEKFLKYVRGIDAAVETLKNGAQIAFLLEPTTIDQVADTSFSGGVMPQKSTDFYPKLLTGMAIYKLNC